NWQVADVLDDFRWARFLELNAYEVPYEEGIVWLVTEPSLAIAAWQESLRRVGVQKEEMYGHMLALASQRSPAVHRGLQEIGLVDHDLALVYLQGAAGADFMNALHRFLDHDPNLQTLSGEEKPSFFSLWADRGDLNELARAVEIRPDWMNHAWRGVAKYHSKRDDFRNAFEVVRRFGEKPALPETAADLSIDQLRQTLHAMPANY